MPAISRRAICRAGRDDGGGMSLELVLMTPIFVLFLMLLAAVGRYVDAQSQIDGAARDAVRAASVARSAEQARRLAHRVGTDTLRGTHWCRGGPAIATDTRQWGPGGRVAVTVTCTVDLGDLMFLGLPATRTFTGNAVAPIDTYSYRGTDFAAEGR
ncbi:MULTISPECIES: TadE family protein [Thermomonospora]|uniref:TadE family protein n=1 Tax=Thermomonospora curvata (strain ATCC 19995 / DSM 43183 / JCM 3096 / KCTC 9072 / NBRC 15933 / NCIMB 10081 / Henssen B9) TaxID=471852 RepID=D1A212_THECD|nr:MULTISPECIES: TadE family protein [Thermomonospora]ACY99665.1 TadE family protein [Thermomonospora curvata DSM 43183]PKK12686.1 MAG: TadE family protein [Thermomonospora sp. CIF 1]